MLTLSYFVSRNSLLRRRNTRLLRVCGLMQEEGLGFGGGSVVLFDGAEEDG